MKVFMIKYGDGLFVDALKIDIVCAIDGLVEFSVGARDFVVEPDSVSSFLNHFQALNEGLISVESELRKCLD